MLDEYHRERALPGRADQLGERFEASCGSADPHHGDGRKVVREAADVSSTGSPVGGGPESSFRPGRPRDRGGFALDFDFFLGMGERGVRRKDCHVIA
jgi:hypothetical protein